MPPSSCSFREEKSPEAWERFAPLLPFSRRARSDVSASLVLVPNLQKDGCVGMSRDCYPRRRAAREIPGLLPGQAVCDSRVPASGVDRRPKMGYKDAGEKEVCIVINVEVLRKWKFQ